MIVFKTTCGPGRRSCGVFEHRQGTLNTSPCAFSTSSNKRLVRRRRTPPFARRPPLTDIAGRSADQPRAACCSMNSDMSMRTISEIV